MLFRFVCCFDFIVKLDTHIIPLPSHGQNTCTATLKRMQDAFERHRKGDPMELRDFFHLSDDIERALYVFDHTSNHAVMRLYRRTSDTVDRFSLTSEDAVPTILANGDNETVFLVYLYVCRVYKDPT
jgi:hypothetical protein